MLNKNTKMFLLLTLIFFTAVGLSVVSATEIDADASDIPVATQEIAADSSDISVDTVQSDLSNKNTQLNKKTVENVKSEGEGTFTELETDTSESEVTLAKDSNVNMPEPLDITLNDGNWTKYFDETYGTINSDLVVNDSILRFDGVFTGRSMIIDMPVTITTADNQAILNNCTFKIMSDNVNIKDIQMNSDDYNDALIDVFEASDVVIENNNLTITNNELNQITRAIKVYGGERNVIKNNVINTIGPENDIVYNDDGSVKLIYTTSIEAVGSNNITVTGNKIFTIKNDVNASDFGTIYGVYVIGESYSSIINDSLITENTIETSGDVYEYGITVNNGEYMTIADNIVNTRSDNYACGIQTYNLVESTIEQNEIDSLSEKLSYGILLNGFFDWENFEGYEANLDTISNNIINLESDNAWGIELYFGSENSVTENNITIDCDYGVGVGIADASDNTVTDNTIAITAAMEGSPDTMDMVSPIPAGVKAQASFMRMHAATDNEITNNNIVVDAPITTVPAVNVTQRSTITENYLIAPKGLGDAAVADTSSSGTIIQDNLPKMYVITEDTYANFFTEEGVFNTSTAENGSFLNVSGEIFNKDFIFDNVELVIFNDGTAKLYNATIITQNNAKVLFDGLVINNTNKQAVYFESEGNELINTEITVESDDVVFPVEIAGDNNYISKVKIFATVPSADVKYGPAPDYKTEVPAPAALLITSSNNLVEDVLVVMDGSATATGAWAPTTDGIYILSLDETISNNTISDTIITVVGPNYVYGINVGNAKDTELDNVDVYVMSDYYADAVQLFDADTITITGKLSAYADTQAYGVYSTAMGNGISQNILILGSKIEVVATDATGVLFEGSNNSAVIETAFDIEGANASAVMAYIDWMGNIPNYIDVSRCNIDITTDGERNVLYFGKCNDVSVSLNTIKSDGGSEIFFNEVPGAAVIDNYIMIKDTIIGNHAVQTTEEDTVIENNTPVNEEYEAMVELLKMYQTSIITIDDIDDVVYRDEVTITGKLNDGMGNLIPDQTLTITIGDLIDNVTTENGLFEYTIVAKQMGENTVTITYEGTENNNPAEATTTFTVNKKESQASINDIATVTCNDNVTISGMITDIDGNPLGHVNVYVYLNGEQQHVTTYRTGIFKATFTTSTVGEQEVLVVYKGNDKYLKSNATATFTATATKLIMYKVKPVTYRDNYTIQGKLTDAEGNIITGAEVKLTINGETVTLITDKNGKYTYKARALALGEFTVTASYVDEATGTELTITKTLEVTKRAVTLIVDEISDVAVGEEVTITGKLTDDIDTPYKNCNIYVDINGEQQHIKTDTKGIFTCTYTPVSAGTQNVTITYKGSTNYLGDKVTTTFKATA